MNKLPTYFREIFKNTQDTWIPIDSDNYSFKGNTSYRIPDRCESIPRYLINSFDPIKEGYVATKGRKE